MPLNRPPCQLSRADAWCRSRRRWLLGGLLLLAVLLRVVYAVQLSDTAAAGQHRWSESDMSFFDTWARSIHEGDWLGRTPQHPHHGWHRNTALLAMGRDPGLRAAMDARAASLDDGRTAEELLWNTWWGGLRYHQEPVYAYFVALTQGPVSSGWGTYLAQMLLGIASILLVVSITRSAFGETTGFVAGILATACAPALFYELVLLRATCLLFAGLVLAWWAQRMVGQATLRRCLVLGVLCGVALLTKSTFALFLLGAAVALAWPVRKVPRAALARLASLGCGVLLALAPLVARNLAVGVSPFAASSVAAPGLAMTNGPHATASQTGAELNYDDLVRIMLASEGQVARAASAAFALHDDPWDLVRRWQLRLGNVFHWYEAPQNVNLAAYQLEAPILSWLPVDMLAAGALGLAGLWLARRKLTRSWPLLLLLATSLVPLVLFSTLARYRLPLLVGLLPFAAWTLVVAASALAQRRRGVALAIGISVVATGSFIGRPLPPGTFTVRAHDRIQPYNFHHAPRIEAALKADDMVEAVRELERYLRHPVPEIEGLDGDHLPLTYHQDLLAKHYAKVWRLYASFLEHLGRGDEAIAARTRGDRLATATRVNI